MGAGLGTIAATGTVSKRWNYGTSEERRELLTRYRCLRRRRPSPATIRRAQDRTLCAGSLPRINDFQLGQRHLNAVAAEDDRDDLLRDRRIIGQSKVLRAC